MRWEHPHKHQRYILHWEVIIQVNFITWKLMKETYNNSKNPSFCFYTFWIAYWNLLDEKIFYCFIPQCGSFFSVFLFETYHRMISPYCYDYSINTSTTKLSINWLEISIFCCLCAESLFDLFHFKNNWEPFLR